MTTTTAVPPMVRELAAKTAAEIRRRGWTKGWYYDDLPGLPLEECPVCVFGAMNAAEQRHVESLPSPGGVELASEILRRLHLDPSRFNAVTHWNDAEDRTVDEVLAVLDAIATAE